VNDWKRDALRRVVYVTIVLVVGFVLGAIGDDAWWGTVGWVLVGLALIVYVALAFYEVGLSEDRDRASRGGRQ
jgi:cell shape-determining protein MreD